MLLEALLRAQAREGWLSPDTLRDVARETGAPLFRVQGLASFYTHFRRTPPAPGGEVRVCRDLACMLAGGARAAAAARARLAGREVELGEVSCLGRCDAAPAAQVGDEVITLDASGAAAERALDGESPRVTLVPARWPAADPYGDPGEHHGALRAARERPPQELIAEIERSGLRGMGGAGFPTARKWALVAAEPAPRHVICNADESEPGTFKDREILRDLPHLVIEGMALAAHAVGAERGSVFVRHEYAPERHALELALVRAREAGAVGPDALGPGRPFEIDVFVSPGGYILGEETALLECMEDRRGEPRNKPPFPGQRGLNGRPTLINNVETLAHAAAIIRRGAEWWLGLGREGFTGQKFVSISGDVERPQVLLVPTGTPLRELLEACGGVRAGAELGAIAPGGASSPFLGPEALDTPLDFDALQRAGSMLGSGAVIFVAAGRALLDVALNVTRFFRNESCGKCVPCRIGTQKAVQLLEHDGALDAGSRQQLRELHETLARTSICGLGQVALAPLVSLLDRVPGPGAG